MPEPLTTPAASTLRTLGAVYDGATTTFRVWAPDHERVDVVLDGGTLRPMAREPGGYWAVRVERVRPGTLYRYRLNGSADHDFPDPASRFQPEGIHGPSQVLDPAAYVWSDADWRAPALHHLVFYELHVGTFSPAGAYTGVAERLGDLAELGVTAIELMPLGEFPGRRNWGYDPAALFAPSRAYGAPDELRALVDAAHAHGLAVFIDVVYNHFGPDGAYANAFSPHYFTDAHRSPWGRGVNLDGPHSGAVRQFFIENALHWIDEYHVDGLRLDATHALQDDSPRHFLAELTTTVRAHAGRPVLFIAEDHRNLASMLLPVERGGFGIDGVWADDFHHQVRVHTAGDREGYFMDFRGDTADIATTLRQGWFFTGQPSHHTGGPRGSDPMALAPEQFVICVQNHDQVGNRADGSRLSHDVDAAAYRAVSALLLLAPQTPLLFMGQEWAASAPFLYFTDHNEELGRLVTEGRREEFKSFSAFADPARRARIPDPQSDDTFIRSRLDWTEREAMPHAGVLRLYRRLLALRRAHPALHAHGRDACDVQAPDDRTVLLERHHGADALILAVRLSGAGSVQLDVEGTGRILLSTEDADIAADPQPVRHDVRAAASRRIELAFARPGAIVCEGRLAHRAR